MAHVLILCALLALSLPGSARGEVAPNVDPARINYLYVGDTADPNHPQTSGIYKIEIEGPTRRSHKWGGGENVKVPLTGLQPGAYSIKAFDGLGNVTEKRINIIRYVEGPAEPSAIVRSTAIASPLPAPQAAAKTIVGPPDCRILTFGPANEVGDQVFSTNDFASCLWDLNTGAAVSLGLGRNALSTLSAGRPGRFFLMGQNGIALLDLETRRATEMNMGGRNFMPSWPLLAPDGKTLIVGGQEFLSPTDHNKRAFSVLAWDLERPGPPKVIQEGFDLIPAALCISSDGKTLVIRGRDLRFVEYPGGKTLKSFPENLDTHSVSCQFSPDGSTVYRGMSDGLQLMRKDQAGAWAPAETWLREGPGKGETVRLSADGKWLASVANYRLLRIWDAAAGTVLWSALSGESWARDAQFSKDGKTFSVSSYADGTLRTWNVATGRLNMLLRPEPSR